MENGGVVIFFNKTTRRCQKVESLSHFFIDFIEKYEHIIRQYENVGISIP